MRDKVELTYTTPLPSAFTKPTASKMLDHLLAEKHMIERVEPDARKIVSYDERTID
jgi:sulfide:quinone oxidoreductase